MQARLTLWPAVLGALFALTFAPDPLPAWSLGWVQLVVLAIVAHWGFSRTPRQAALSGLMFGLATFAVGLYWLTISMHVYGQMALPLAWLALLLFSLYLALYPALALGLTAWLLQRTPNLHPLKLLWLASVWASAWTLAEMLRGVIFTGFPWLSTAYGQTDTWIAGWSVALGAPGSTWVTAWIAGAVAATLAAEAKQRDSTVTPKRALAVALAIVLAFVGALLQQTNFTEAAGEPLIARLVQGNVDQGIKFDNQRFNQAHEHHLGLARHQAKGQADAANTPPNSDSDSDNLDSTAQPDLILLPETIMARLSNRVPAQHWQDWIDVATTQNTTVLLGAPLYGPEPGRYTNSVIAIDGQSTPTQLAQGLASDRYDKQHLVPFGEFVPTGFRWFIDLMQIPLGDFNRGDPEQAPFAIAHQKVAPNICYEDIFGAELLPAVRQGATILANFSNLGWFGNSSALRQHWQMARFRSMETRRPTLRATNTGITGAIDPSGRVIAQLPVLTAGYVDVRVQGHTGLTPYAQWGNYPMWILVCVILGIGLFGRLRRLDTANGLKDRNKPSTSNNPSKAE